MSLDDRKLRKIMATLDPRAEQILGSSAFAIEGGAKMRAPVMTGALRNSLHTEKKGHLHYRIADGVEYGIYQELGTHRMAAQPFLIPAVEEERPYLNKRWAELFK